MVEKYPKEVITDEYKFFMAAIHSHPYSSIHFIQYYCCILCVFLSYFGIVA